MHNVRSSVTWPSWQQWYRHMRSYLSIRSRTDELRERMKTLELKSWGEEEVVYLFDGLGIVWEYEGAKLQTDQSGVFYVPDFWLPELGLFIESKIGHDIHREHKASSAALELRKMAGQPNLDIFLSYNGWLAHVKGPYCPSHNIGQLNPHWCIETSWIKCRYCHHWQPFPDIGPWWCRWEECTADIELGVSNEWQMSHEDMLQLTKL
jgi:hypothetical protein